MTNGITANEIELLKSLMHPWAIIGVTAWELLFTLLFFWPRFGLGRIWKEKIRDYDKATMGLGVLVFGITVVFFSLP